LYNKKLVGRNYGIFGKGSFPGEAAGWRLNKAEPRRVAAEPAKRAIAALPASPPGNAQPPLTRPRRRAAPRRSAAAHVQPAVPVPKPHRQGGLQGRHHQALGGHRQLDLARVLQAQ
jgi:hypothetical protein